jgi:hypothetical protein
MIDGWIDDMHGMRRELMVLIKGGDDGTDVVINDAIWRVI